jgi:hypothetical protein
VRQHLAQRLGNQLHDVLRIVVMVRRAEPAQGIKFMAAAGPSRRLPHIRAMSKARAAEQFHIGISKWTSDGKLNVACVAQAHVNSVLGLSYKRHGRYGQGLVMKAAAGTHNPKWDGLDPSRVLVHNLEQPAASEAAGRRLHGQAL